MDKEQKTEITKSNENVHTDETRRKLTKAAIVAPVVTSIVSRPVLGETLACNLSGLISGNLSQHDHECGGNGCTPGYWKNNPETWLMRTSRLPGECGKWHGNSCKEWDAYSKATTFLQAFGAYSRVEPDDGTLMSILLRIKNNVAGNSNLETREFHYIAALLNAEADSVLYGTTPDKVITFVQHYSSTDGSPFPVPGTDKFVTEDEFFQVIVSMNENGLCPYNAHGDCAEEETNTGTECVPACADPNQAFNFCTGECDDKVNADRTFELYITDSCNP